MAAEEPVTPKKSKKDKGLHRKSWLARSSSKDGANNIARKSDRHSMGPGALDSGLPAGMGPAPPSPLQASRDANGGSSERFEEPLSSSPSSSSASSSSSSVKWHKGDVMSPEVLARQRNLEQFLLKFEMKRLRGTSWRYYDLSSGSDSADGGLLGSLLHPGDQPQQSEPSLSDSTGGIANTNTSPSTPIASGSSTALSAPGGEGKVRSTTAQEAESNKEAIIVVPSGGVGPEAHFEHIIGLASRGFRVIAPRLPDTLDDFEDYSAGLCLIMRQEKIGRAHFFGLGMGGMVVQHLLYRSPERVLTATLAHTTPPDEELAQRSDKTHKPHKHFKAALVGYKVKDKDLEAEVHKIKGDEKALWLGILKQFQTPKPAVVVYSNALVSGHRDIAYVPADFSRFKGDLFLIDSQRPECIPSLEEQRVLFPGASVFVSPNNGPLYTLIRGNKTAQRVVEFIRQSRAIRKRRKAEKDNQKLLKSPSSSETKASSYKHLI